jgi:hypothetical protein
LQKEVHAAYDIESEYWRGRAEDVSTESIESET